MENENPFGCNGNPFFNDFRYHREIRIYGPPSNSVPNTPRTPIYPVPPSTVGDFARNAATNIIVNAALGGVFNVMRYIGPTLVSAFRKKGAVAASSTAQNKTAVWLGNVAMLSEKLPKKARGDFLNTLHANFSDDAIVWILTKQTADKLVLFLQVIVVVAGGIIIFLFIRHRLILREKRLIEELSAKLQGQDKETQNKNTFTDKRWLI